MTDAPKISLGQQAEAVRFAKVRQDSLLDGNKVVERRARKEAEYDAQRLAAAIRTLEWLAKHEDELKRFLRFTPAIRKAALDHAEFMLEDGLIKEGAI